MFNNLTDIWKISYVDGSSLVYVHAFTGMSYRDLKKIRRSFELNQLNTSNAKDDFCSRYESVKTPSMEEQLVDSNTGMSYKRFRVSKPFTLTKKENVCKGFQTMFLHDVQLPFANSDEISSELTKVFKQSVLNNQTLWNSRDNTNSNNKVSKWKCSKLKEEIRNRSENQVQANISNDIFSTLTVIGQADDKYIVTSAQLEGSSKKALIIFDQHAVHERILLEQKLYQYKSEISGWKMFKLSTCMELKFPPSYKYLLVKYSEKFEKLGLQYNVENNEIITVKGVPLHVHEFALKYSKCDYFGALSQQVKGMINEQVENLCSDKSFNLNSNTLLSTMACREATKFGDKLTLDQCTQLIKALAKCTLPFQCAHGRPSLAPMCFLDDLNKEHEPRLNLKMLSKATATN